MLLCTYTATIIDHSAKERATLLGIPNEKLRLRSQELRRRVTRSCLSRGEGFQGKSATMESPILQGYKSAVLALLALVRQVPSNTATQQGLLVGSLLKDR